MVSARVSRSSGSVHASNASAALRRLPVAGRIRPGIKVLTAAASKVPGLSEVYADGLKEGIGFDEIAVRLKKVKGCPAYPLTPKNAPYFSVRAGDFSSPDAAQAIMDRYGSVRQGDPSKRLYDFPVIFPSDNIDLIFREQFEAWKATELLRWSEIDPQSGDLMCMKRTVAAPDPSARRRWGGRPTEVDRTCDPNDCLLFGKGECKHVGTLNFWIPGVPGVGTIELTFTSIYASLGIAETLDMVRMGLGRVSGLLPDGSTIFRIAKRRERVSRMNWETGKAEKSDQWIIALEATGLDMSRVLSGALALPAPETRTVPALSAPEQPADEPREAIEPEPGKAEHAAPSQIEADPVVREMRKQLSALVSTLGWSTEDLSDWVTANYSDTSAARNPKSLEDMIAKLTVLAKAEAERTVEQAPAGEPAAAVEDDEVPF
jgi:hypothetical protein